MAFFSARASSMLRITASSVVLVAGVLAFQNCGKAGFEDFETTELSSSDVDPKLANLPFPYDVSINQMVYMSCPNRNMQTGSPEALFTFHVGAYDNSGTIANSVVLASAGLNLRSSYKSAFESAMSFYTPSLHTGKLKEALMTVPVAKGFQPQVAFRETASARNKMTRWLNFDYEVTSVLMLGPLSQEKYADKVALNPNKSINFFNTASSLNKGTLSAYLQLPAPVAIQDEYFYRSIFNSNRLSLAFVDATKTGEVNAGGFLAASPGEDHKFYGRSFQIGFDNPFNGPNELSTNHSLYPDRSVDTITEYDATNPGVALQANWKCDYKFKIVRPEDRMKPIWRISGNDKAFSYSCDPTATTAEARAASWYCACPPESYEELNTSENLAVYHMLRRALPAEGWDINVSKRCVVPKQGYNLCYQGYPSNVPISYDEFFFPESARDANASPPKYGECDTPGQPACAHFVTLCYKQ